MKIKYIRRILVLIQIVATSGLTQVMGQTAPRAPTPGQPAIGQPAFSATGNGAALFGQGYSGYFGQGSFSGNGQTFVNPNNQWYVSPYTQRYAGYISPYSAGYDTNLGYGLSGAALGAYSAVSGGFNGGWTQGNADATGIANLVRSQGDYNESTARAAGEYQKARSQWIENQNRVHEELLSRRRSSQAIANEDHEAARATRERQQKFIAAHRPPPLNSDQLDTETGHIEWPVALKAPEFDQLRPELESLFEARSKYGATTENRSQLLSKIRESQDLLRGEVISIPLPDYTESSKFLERMLATARQ